MNNEVNEKRRVLLAEKGAMEERIKEIYQELDKLSERSSISTLVLAIIPPGVHRLLSGKILSGLVYMFTCGGFIIWMIIDIITIGVGKFKDKDGKYINSTKKCSLAVELSSLESRIEDLDRKLMELN